MKKLSLITSLLAFAFVSIISMKNVNAEQIKKDGDYQYTVSNNEATIVAYTGSNTTISFPKKIGGYNVVAIGNNVSKKVNLVSVTIPDTVKTLNNDVFRNCTKLQSVTLPDSITKIGSGAFYNCAALNKITIPSKVKVLYTGTFYNCMSLETLTLPNKISTMGNSVFENCISLKSIKMSKNIKKIGDKVFKDCTNLASISFGDNFRTMGISCFENCKSLKSFKLSDKCTLTVLPSKTFKNCENLTSVSLLKGLTSINESAFLGCGKITEIKLPSTVKNIGDSTFKSCKSLNKVTLSSALTNIPKNCFYECNLSQVIIPKNIKTIEENAFAYNKKLTKVTLQNGLTSIKSKAYYHCVALMDIKIPNSVKEIGDKAFGYIFDDVYYNTDIKNPKFLIYCDENTAGRSYAINNDFKNEKLPCTHSYGEWKIIKKATVLQTGERVRSCSICKVKQTEKIAKLKPTITVSKKKITLKINESYKVKVTGLQRGDSVKKWVVVTKGIATVKNGKITGKKKGSTYIRIELASKKKAVIKVIVQ